MNSQQSYLQNSKKIKIFFIFPIKPKGMGNNKSLFFMDITRKLRYINIILKIFTGSHKASQEVQ